MKHSQLITTMLMAVLLASLAHAQGFGRRRAYIEQNEPPATEFIAARWHFGTNGAIGNEGSIFYINASDFFTK